MVTSSLDGNTGTGRSDCEAGVEATGVVNWATSGGQGEDNVGLMVTATGNLAGNGQVGWTDNVARVGASDMVNLGNVMEMG